jgi:hypothetical protein
MPVNTPEKLIYKPLSNRGQENTMNNFHNETAVHCPRRRGVVTAEYLLLVTLIGIGVLVGLATLRNAIVAELTDCATAVSKIIVP